MTKNIGKSIRTRLLNLAKEEKLEYMRHTWIKTKM